MSRIYAILIVVICIYALGHMAYTFFYEELKTAESMIWFFSAGLALLFNAFINILHLKFKDVLVKRITIAANVVLLLFIAYMSLIVSEAQVFVLIVVLFAVLTCSGQLPVEQKAER